MENGIPPPLRPEDSRPECADQCWEKCLSRKDFECCQTADFGGKTLIVYGHSVDGYRDVFNFFIKKKREKYIVAFVSSEVRSWVLKKSL